MITVDQLLIKIINQNFGQARHLIPSRDIKVLKSIGKIVNSPNFITENQGRLLLRILKDNTAHFVSIDELITFTLDNPTWSKLFRTVDKTKRMYSVTDATGIQHIVVEFAFSTALTKTIRDIGKRVSSLVQLPGNKFYTAEYTEQNIVSLIEALSPLDFVIDKNLEDFYAIIKSWNEKEIKDQFQLTTIAYPNFHKQITADLGIHTAIDTNIINDRSMRYQYFTEKSEKLPENLTETIAQRNRSRIWVDKNKHTLTQVIESLSSLKRLPILVVFDSYDPRKCLEEMRNLSESLEDNRVYNDVGIYFRLDSTQTGKEFNQFIADKQYNIQLDNNTKVVGVQSGKIPKFLLKVDWKPMSVISIGRSLSHSKTAVYSNTCDLIITYSDSEPIVENRILWE